MVKNKIIAAALVCLGLTSCGFTPNTASSSTGSTVGNVLGAILGAATNGETVGNLIGSVLGTNKPKESDLVGSWKYKQPGVAFTSENLLAKAGGQVAATTVKEKLATTYKQVGISSSNTYFTIKEDKTFSGKVDGTPLSGTWTYDASSQKLTLKTLLFSMPCYAEKTSTGMSFLFESKKLLSVLQTVAAVSGNSTLSTIGDLSKNYDGVRMGFDMKR